MKEHACTLCGLMTEIKLIAEENDHVIKISIKNIETMKNQLLRALISYWRLDFEKKPRAYHNRNCSISYDAKNDLYSFKFKKIVDPSTREEVRWQGKFKVCDFWSTLGGLDVIIQEEKIALSNKLKKGRK